MTISLVAYARADIQTSWSALEAVKSKSGNRKAMKGIAAYHAQQVIEKIIKAEIYRVNPHINPQKMYTHKIYDLCAIAESNGIKVPKEIKDKAYMYSDWEAAGRYDLHFSVRVDSIEKALYLAENWLNGTRI
ncbi:MAG: HEPN domain-containing protein [Bacteroidales bacterium]|nr:HEPN domain-containing protein [Lachnoclostridium sp.]MCM1384302.1 HEPN domain-containing protein [Lachnoclostridium sp.]MCM1464883.1 HEPN domain-containing protein [Bacteroidales bacterium]